MKKILMILTMALAATSCMDILDVAPEDQIASENMWTTEELADKGMAGLYFPFYATQLSSTQLRRADGLNRQGIEAMSFATDYYSNNYPVELLSLATKPANDFQVWYEWKFCYTIIHACNDAIANLHKADMSANKLARYQCEARFLRAWAYNRLNMLYQGVPVYLEPINNEDCTRGQSSVDEVWQVILDDLTYCINNPDFPNNTLNENYGRPSKGAAYALRGMVYMWKKQYKEAGNDFKEVETCGYGLWTGEYADFFKYENEKDKEMIFSLQFSEETGYCDNIQQMTGARDTYDGWTEIKPSADFVDYYKNADGSDFKWSEVDGLEVYMWKKQYKEAGNDFKEVETCGYGLWTGEYADFFKYENEKDKEMIFSLQFSEETGYCDNIQQMTGARDTYDGWTEIKPSADFVDYYKNADGSDFKWSEVDGLQDWDLLTPKQREIFFCRDGLESMSSQKNALIKRVGEDIYQKYYLNSGNEARIKKAYDSRDPRLQQTVVTPYVAVDCYKPNYAGDANQIGKQLRWPLKEQGTNGGDFWLDKRTSAFYCYRKYNEFEKGRLISRSRCHTDWPLIRYTDVLLQYAEALAQTDQLGEAIRLVNKVRTRAHMPALTEGGSGPCAVNGKEDMLERIRYERRVEFCLEGINFFDEVRWGTYKETKFQGKDVNGGKSWWGDMVEYNWYYTDYMWPWTAPISETQKNPNLTKRSGWAY